jgi:DNA-binding HxlR family transcriptional regulator
MTDYEQLGAGALKLLAERSMVAVLRGLAGGAGRPSELERLLPDVGHSLVMRRLRRLLDRRLVSYEHRPGTPPRARRAGVPQEARYSLTKPGRMLLDLADAADRWELEWGPGGERPSTGTSLAIRLAADPHIRGIALMLAAGPLSSVELEGRSAELRRSALRRRLRELVSARLLERCSSAGLSSYGLTASARRLALLALLAGRWELRCGSAAVASAAQDLASLLALLAPLARAHRSLNGLCRLELAGGGERTCAIYLSLDTGAVAVLAGRPTQSPAAVARADPGQLCRSLLDGRQLIATSGDQALLSGALEALADALR